MDNRFQLLSLTPLRENDRAQARTINLAIPKDSTVVAATDGPIVVPSLTPLQLDGRWIAHGPGQLSDGSGCFRRRTECWSYLVLCLQADGFERPTIVSQQDAKLRYRMGTARLAVLRLMRRRACAGVRFSTP